ncbi:hypothetical protein ACH5AJ_07605 [Streptomyces rochei]|nr:MULTISPECIES: hypothetical protein [Streptomyces]MCC8450324.1 hypothetical protein [Streptomyces rochei]
MTPVAVSAQPHQVLVERLVEFEELVWTTVAAAKGHLDRARRLGLHES